MKRLITKALILSGSMFFLSAMNAIAGEELQLWGSTTCQKRFLEPGAEALEKATGIKIKVLGVGTGKGMLALFDGKATVALASEILDDAVASAQKEAVKAGKEVTVPGDLQFHEITRDIIVPIVNKDNSVEALTWAQLTDLNTGKVTNWKEVGGPDLPVVVITSHAGSATKSVFQKMVMNKADYAANAIEVKSTRLEIAEVTKNKGGIGAVSSGFFNINPDGAKIVKSDTIDRPLGLITIGAPSPEVQKVIDYFKSPEGQKQIVE